MAFCEVWKGCHSVGWQTNLNLRKSLLLSRWWCFFKYHGPERNRKPAKTISWGMLFNPGSQVGWTNLCIFMKWNNRISLYYVAWTSILAGPKPYPSKSIFETISNTKKIHLSYDRFLLLKFMKLSFTRNIREMNYIDNTKDFFGNRQTSLLYIALVLGNNQPLSHFPFITFFQNRM